MLQAGDQIEVISLMHDPNPMEIGTKGTVKWVNGARGRLHTQIGVDWENGRKLMLIWPMDAGCVRVIGRKR